VRPTSHTGSGRRRSRYVLLVLTLLAVTLITLDARGVIALGSAKEGAVDVLAPVRSGARWVTTPFRNAWNGITGYEGLEQENSELRAELERLRGEEMLEENARAELQRLQEQLNLGFVGDLDTQIARVTTGAYSNFEDHTLELDKGSDHGLAVGNPVVAGVSGEVDGGGLVGRLVQVSRTRSVVQLITDPDLHIGIRLVDPPDIGVGRGGEGGTFIVDRGIDITDPVEPGEGVLTGGLEDAIMPAGVPIPIGNVTRVTPDPAAFTQVLHVEFSVDFSRLDVVQVIKWVPDE
jgi:rod shape-determining protein MreC